MRTPYTREKLIQDFLNLGIAHGDTLFIHSSFKSLGPVEDGAGTVIAALEAAVAAFYRVWKNASPRGMSTKRRLR
ncbi:hypothetical protein J4G07_21245 [Candidatus Poribacteria bacterium]|nr:hypothetical protein [Candidatus Poribacteria bacterium]